MSADELAALRRPFRIALVGVAALFVCIGGLIAAFGTGADRPEGVAERWLTAAGDTTRDGVGDEAASRLRDLGGADLVPLLVPAGADAGGKRAFEDIEVAKAMAGADGSKVVAFRVHRRDGVGPAPEATGALVLARDGDGWRVQALLPDGGNRLPGDGGPALARAPVALYAGAVVVGLLVTIGCSVLVRRAGAVPIGA